MAVRDIVQAAAGVGGDKLYVEDVFSTYLYTGTATTLNIENNIDLAGEGGLTWIKSRSSGSLIHVLHDTERGAPERLNSASTDAQATMGAGIGITSFNSNGFTIGTGTNYNASGGSYASWTWRKSPKFFDVVTGTTGSDTNYRISHNLGSVPGCIIFKRTDAASTWIIWHRGLSSTTNNYLKLGYNATDAQSTRTNTWGTSGPTDTDFGIDTTFFGAGISFVAYLFAHDAGGFGDDGEQNVISCGSFTTDGSGLGSVNLGWEPQWLLVKNSSNVGSWVLMDTMRGMHNTGSNGLFANLANAESVYTSANLVPTATGFDLRSNLFNANDTLIYIAIRRGPMKTPESGTEVFAVDYQGTGGVLPGYKAPFPVDMGMWTDRDGGNKQITSRLTNDRLMYANLTDAELGSASYSFDYQNGFMDIATTDTTRVGWMFRRAPSFFDVVAYTGTGVARTVAHNLGVVPELMIVKARSKIEDWSVYHSGITSPEQNYLYLNSTSALNPNSNTIRYWNHTNPTDSVFTLGDESRVNGSGFTYIAYLFASCPGVSKVSSYTGTGADINVDCGFSAGARFVLIKRTDSTGDWYVWDSARGIVSGNDPYLLLNSTAAENTSTDYIDPLASGFTVTSSAPAALNASGGSYIFLAIA